MVAKINTPLVQSGAPEDAVAVSSESKSNKVALGVGLGLGLTALVVILVLGVWWLRRRHNSPVSPRPMNSGAQPVRAHVEPQAVTWPVLGNSSNAGPQQQP